TAVARHRVAHRNGLVAQTDTAFAIRAVHDRQRRDGGGTGQLGGRRAARPRRHWSRGEWRWRHLTAGWGARCAVGGTADGARWERALGPRARSWCAAA